MNAELIVSSNRSAEASVVPVFDEPQTKAIEVFRKMKPTLSLVIDTTEGEALTNGKIYGKARDYSTSRARLIMWSSEAASGISSAQELRLEVSTIRINRCVELFEAGEIEKGMRLARSTNYRQKLQLCKNLIDRNLYNHAAAVARLMTPHYKLKSGYGEVMEVCRSLNNKKQHDLAVELILEIPSQGFEFDFLEECKHLISSHRDDLAITLAMAKLNKRYKFIFCEFLISENMFDKVLVFARLIEDPVLIKEIGRQCIYQGEDDLANELTKASLDG